MRALPPTWSEQDRDAFLAIFCAAAKEHVPDDVAVRDHGHQEVALGPRALVAELGARVLLAIERVDLVDERLSASRVGIGDEDALERRGRAEVQREVLGEQEACMPEPCGDASEHHPAPALERLGESISARTDVANRTDLCPGLLLLSHGCC